MLQCVSREFNNMFFTGLNARPAAGFVAMPTFAGAHGFNDAIADIRYKDKHRRLKI